MTKTMKMLLIALGVIALIMVVVLASGSGGSDSQADVGLVQNTGSLGAGGILSESANSEVNVDDLVILLRSMSSIDLDTSILSNPAYLALGRVDVVIPRDPFPGRDNPFFPIGVDPVLTERFNFSTITNPLVTEEVAIDGSLEEEVTEEQEGSEVTTEDGEENTDPLIELFGGEQQ